MADDNVHFLFCRKILLLWNINNAFRNKFFSFVTKKWCFVTKVFKNRFKHHIIVMDVSIHFAQWFSFKKCRGNNLYTFLFKEKKRIFVSCCK